MKLQVFTETLLKEEEIVGAVFKGIRDIDPNSETGIAPVKEYYLKERGSNIKLLISQDVKDFIEAFSVETQVLPEKMYTFNGRRYTIIPA